MATQPKVPVGTLNGVKHSTFHPAARTIPSVPQPPRATVRPVGHPGIPKRTQKFLPTGGD